MTRESVERYILNRYKVSAEYPWFSAPGYAVYRHTENKKWFAVVMNISKRKLGIDSDEIADVMNIKCDPLLISSLLCESGFFPAYHMNKVYWITVMLDGNVEEERIKWLIDISFELTQKQTGTK